MNISTDLICLINFDFSYLSATSPASEENKKKGKMNIAPVVATRILLFSESPSKTLRIKNMMIENLRRLSLNAPKNWVKKRGPKRFVKSKDEKRALEKDDIISGLEWFSEA